MKKPTKAAIEKLAKEMHRHVHFDMCEPGELRKCSWANYVKKWPRSAACWRLTAEYVLTNFDRKRK